MDFNCLNFFNTRLCLTTDNRPDRWKQAAAEFYTYGIDVDKFLAYPGRDPFHSFNKSQYEMMRLSKANGGSLLTFEDDVEFVTSPSTEKILAGAMAQLPENWDIVYLGCNITEEKPAPFSDYLCHIRSAWTTHAVAYNARVIKHITLHFDPDHNHMYDDWLSREVLTKFNCFVVNPMVAWQRTGRSELWGKETDYWPAYYEGNNKMQP